MTPNSVSSEPGAGHGEVLVRQKLASKQHYSEVKEQQARAWLEHKAQRARETSEAEQIAIARSASDAALKSAEAARQTANAADIQAAAAQEAAKASKRANIISGIALIVAVFSIVLSFYFKR